MLNIIIFRLNADNIRYKLFFEVSLTDPYRLLIISPFCFLLFQITMLNYCIIFSFDFCMHGFLLIIYVSIYYFYYYLGITEVPFEFWHL